MSASRRILCPCEDISADEVRHAVSDEHRTLEQVKRVTGLGTGTCQGRQCLVPCIELLMELTGEAAETVGLMTLRAPARPPLLGELAGPDPAPQEDSGLPPAEASPEDRA